MNPPADSLERLHDIVAPPAAPWWPPAPGWYWLMGFALVAALYLLVRGILWWQQHRYRREALAEWRRLNGRLESAETRTGALAELAALLKRTALSAFPREQVAALTGRDWAAFLDSTMAQPAFATETGQLLERAAYGLPGATHIDPASAQASAELVRQWIVGHRANLQRGGD
jgi:hypothetical protein